MEQQNTVNDKLMEACRKLDMKEIQELIQMGAEVNYQEVKNTNGWYSGDTTTPLFAAITSYAKDVDEKDRVDIIELLFKNGADPKFSACRGNWNHASSTNCFTAAQRTMGGFSKNENKVRLLRLFAENGANLNVCDNQGRDKGHRGWGRRSYFIFDMMSQSGLGSKISEIESKETNGVVQKFTKELNKEENKLIDEFNQKFNRSYKRVQYDEEEEEDHSEEKQQPNEEEIQKKKAEELKRVKEGAEFIESILDCGFDLNVKKTSYHWEETGVYGGLPKLNGCDDYRSSQTVLHIAIMNNCVDLTLSLIKRGTDVNAKFVYTIQEEVPAQENTGEEYDDDEKKYQLESNQRESKSLQERIKELEEQIEKKKAEPEKPKDEETKKEQKDDEDEEREYEETLEDLENELKYSKESLDRCDYEIYKSENPMKMGTVLTDTVKEISCLELAKRLEVDQKIIDALSEAAAKKEDSAEKKTNDDDYNL